MTARRYDDDPELVLAARAGDGGAFTTLFQRWFDPCVEVARRIVHDPETAAEVAQETFLVAWRQLDTLRDPSAFGGWVLRTARNKALNRLDRERRSVAVDQDTDPVLGSRAAVADVAADVEAADQQRLLWAASAALGERDASVLDLHLRHGLDASGIAEALDITPNNAHQVLFRMKGKLAGAIRAWVLFKGGDPACDGLRAALGDAGITRFSAEAVKAIDRHVARCEDCTRRQAAILAPEAMFAAVPALPVAGLLRERAAAALRDSGVPLGSDAAVPLQPGPGPGPVGADPEADRGDGPGGPHGPASDADAPPPTAAIGAPPSAAPHRRRAAWVLAAAVLVLLGALAGGLVLLGDDDDVAEPEEVAAVGTDTAPTVPTTTASTPEPSLAAPSTDAPAPPAPSTSPPVAGGGIPDAPTTTTTAPPPPAAPAILSFVVTPASAPGGQCPVGQWASTLAWRTTGATSVVITSPAAVAPVAGGPFGTAVGCALTPGGPWTLTATGPGGSTSVTR